MRPGRVDGAGVGLGEGIEGRALGIALVLLLIVIAAGPRAAAAAPAIADSPEARCLACHANRSLTRIGPDGSISPLWVDPEGLRRSAHASLGCFDCHARELEAMPHPANRAPVECATCHEKAAAEFDSSVHAQSKRGLDRKGLPGCTSCHGSHDVARTGGPSAPAFARAMIPFCLACHRDEALAAAYDLPGKEFFAAYEKSVHGPGAGGNGGRKEAAAACTDCHGGHAIRGRLDPDSSVSRGRVAEVCRRCHEAEFGQYAESIHGKAQASGVKDAPACTDCHGEHQILAPAQPGSKVAKGHVAETCSRCHESEKLAERYGIPPRRLSSYLASYHGYANKFGEATVAHCASCHGVHDILPSSDPRSRIHPGRLAETCGRCHPGAGPHFAEGKIHVEPTRESSLGVWVVRNFYIWFIGLLMAGFLVHATLDVAGKVRRRRAAAQKKVGGT